MHARYLLFVFFYHKLRERGDRQVHWDLYIFLTLCGFIIAIPDHGFTSCELPPELCYVIMSPISAATFYTFSIVPLIMHRIESLLVSTNLKRIHADHCTQNVDIPTMKVLVVKYISFYESVDFPNMFSDDKYLFSFINMYRSWKL